VIARQAAALPEELDACRAGIEGLKIDSMRLAGMSDFELDELAASVGRSRLKGELLVQLQRAKAVCEAQMATMRHFDE
jgi:hypothetical protein